MRFVSSLIKRFGGAKGFQVNHSLFFNRSNISATSNSGNNFITGSDVRKEISKPIIQPFKSLNVRGTIIADFVASDNKTIEIHADDNLLDIVEIEYEDSSLNIGLKDNVSFMSRTPICVKIFYPNLEIASLKGSGGVSVSGLEQDEFEMRLSGSGDAYLHGKVRCLKLALKGSGYLNAKTMKTCHLVAQLDGSGDVLAQAKSSVEATLRGSGEIFIHGDPEVRKISKSGSGNIEIK